MFNPQREFQTSREDGIHFINYRIPLYEMNKKYVKEKYERKIRFSAKLQKF